MARIEITMTSTAVDGDYGIVNVYFNGQLVESNLHLNANGITFSHPVVPVAGNCTVQVDLLNDKATDINLDGRWDEVMDVRITSARYADNDVTYIGMVPHGDIITADLDVNGNPIVIPAADHLSVWGTGYSRTFPTSRYIP